MDFYNAIKFIFSPLLKFIFGIKSEGEENLPLKGAVILCSNHRSNYDPVILGAALNRKMRFMAKAELFKFPPLRWLVSHLGAFPVNRGKNDSAAIDKAVEILNDGDMLAMFPEGHRHKQGGTPQRFKSGAALFAYRTHSVVVPAAIVTKGAVRPFKRNIVRIGKPLSYDELCFTDGGSANLRDVSNLLHDRVNELIHL